MTRRREILFAVVAVTASLSTLEFAARLAEIPFPTRAVDYALGFDPGSRLFTTSPRDTSLRVTNPAKVTTFCRQAFRAAKPPRTLRLAAVGGSSVFHLQPEFANLAERLGQELADRYDRVEILNGGGRAYGTHRLVAVLAELLEYDVDAVLLYSGHNEFEEVEQLQLADADGAGLQRLLARSALVRRLRDWILYVRVEVLRWQHNRRILEGPAPTTWAVHARAWRYDFTLADVAERMESYRRNLTLMLDLCRRAGVPIVIGTVPSDLFKPYLPEAAWREYQQVGKLYRSGRMAEGAYLGRKILRETPGRHQSSDLENEIIRSLAAEHGIPLADVERAVVAREPHGVPGETLFRDHCHLNDAGNGIWRETFEQALLEQLR